MSHFSRPQQNQVISKGLQVLIDCVSSFTTIIIRNNINGLIYRLLPMCETVFTVLQQTHCSTLWSLFYRQGNRGSQRLSSFNFTTYTQKTGRKIQICVISKTIPGSIYCAICIIQMITPII